jgi:hypothetical protein
LFAIFGAFGTFEIWHLNLAFVCFQIMPLSGWSHNVTSYRIHVLNCNTILVPSFHYDGRNATRSELEEQ